MEFLANTKKPQQLIDKFQLSMVAAVNIVSEEDVATCILHRYEPDSLTPRELPDFEKYITSGPSYSDLIAILISTAEQTRNHGWREEPSG